MARHFVTSSSQYLAVAGSPVSVEPFALIAWFHPLVLTGIHTVLSVGDASGTRYFALRTRGDIGGDPIAAVAYDGDSNTQALTTSGYTEAWHHGAAIFAGGTDCRCLLDSGNKGTDASAHSAITTDRTTIGVSADSTPYGYLRGYVAETAIYDLSVWPGATDTLKADEFERVVLPACAAGFSPLFVPLGLVAYWPLVRDEDQDRVGGYDMTAYNTPGIAAHPPVIYPAPMSLSYPSGIVAAIPRHPAIIFQCPAIV